MDGDGDGDGDGNAAANAAGVAVTPGNPCCKQLAMKLEKSDSGRKKLRQAIVMLKEKLGAAEKVLQENEGLRRDCERERELALAEKKRAEKEKKARLMLEEEGTSLKEALGMAIARIDSLEASQAADRKDVQHLRNEVRMAVDGVRASGKASETAQSVCNSLEKNLTTKINALPKTGGQNLQTQNGLKTLQATVSTFQDNVFALSTRVSTLEGQCEKHANQVIPVQHSTEGAKATKTTARKAPSKLPPKTQQQRPDLNRENVVRNSNSRFTSTATGAIEVIPGIADILKPSSRVTSGCTTSHKESGPAASQGKKSEGLRPCDLAKIVKDKARNLKDDTGKTGADVTVQGDCDRVPTTASTVLRSISRLFKKEKRAHSKIELKLCELQQALGHHENSHSKRQGKRKKRGTEATDSEKRIARSKGKSSSKKQRIQPDSSVMDDDPEIKSLMGKWLDVKKNLHSPSLPELPRQPQSATCKLNSQTAASPQEASVHASIFPSCQYSEKEAAAQKDVEPLNVDINTGKDQVSNVRGCREETNAGSSTVPQTVALESTPPDDEACFLANEEVRGAILSDASCPHLSDTVITMEMVAGCFLDAEGHLKPQESWDDESKNINLNTTSSSSLLALTSSIVHVLTKKVRHVDVICYFGRFLHNVLPVAERCSALDCLLRLLSSFLISRKTQHFTARITRDKRKNVRSVEDCSICSSKATTDEVTAASKLLAALCESSGNVRVLRTITCKVLRWSNMDSVQQIMVLASLASVSRRLLSDAVIRCVASGLIAEVDSQQSQLADLQDKALLEHLEVSVDATVEEAVQTTLDLLSPEKVSSLDLSTQMDCQRITSRCSEGDSWQIQFHEAVETLELISLHMGWEWTYNSLIVKRLWGLVALGSSQTTVGCVAHLLGNLGRLGLEGGLEMPGVDTLRQWLACILKNEQETFSFATRMVAASALLELSVRDRRAPRFLQGDDDIQELDILSLDFVKVVQEWFRDLDSDKQSSVPLRLRKRIGAAPEKQPEARKAIKVLANTL